MIDLSGIGNQKTDTSFVCVRNSISDVTFYDSDNFITCIKQSPPNSFPFIFIEKTKQQQTEVKATLIKHLKPGQVLPAKMFHEDWSILVILLASFLFLLTKTAAKGILPGVARFFLFRGINDSSSRDAGGLFHWQSTILNLISFLIVGLFAFSAASYFNLIPYNIRGFIFWLLSVGIIIIAVTLRHIICLITGSVSGEKWVFREYLTGVYQYYQLSALILFVLIILLSYTSLLSSEVVIFHGVIILGALYIIRVLRLLIIFINRNISIFYLILYLCALEILPVLMSVKYISGLV